ncbi:peptidoglycan/LPS O-acetylase OafA/YrhL [Azorhizobium sp. AG788]|uniref:acyltransferase family protein n=1 Tax=Azorhizobium sp. AG788 TaxID=2183897 RepID=UPI00105D984E|nr:acyltransferase family protein [Azorhizobium sp. AG788]TDU01156.1 peptidoglycan/LPS O-acetylase OafA/YrhL [Azorhizobium sp. AG788]
MKYRADISGLRALAVVPVVLYHAHAALMPGGFVGVDVFFVISGYLITAIIAGDLAQGRFSLLTFYDRRIRRIVPAYALVMGVTLLAALVSLPPLMLAFFGKSLEFASVFLANKHFLATAGYFQPGVEELPLLHTWSLAVEEQFYLFWPLALFALSHPRLRRIRGVVVWAVLLASLYVASQNAVLRPNSGFYNFTSRAWELLAGGVLALGLLPRLRGRLLPELAALIGVGLIGWALFTFSRTTVFPGLNALFPVGGALLILWAGEEGRQTLVGRVLGLAPIAGIGLISYSLYLWHWPILAFYKFHAGGDPDLVAGVVLVGLAVGVSVLSWRYVEAPFRRHATANRRSEIRSIRNGLIVLAVLAGTGLVIHETNGLPFRASAATRAAQASLTDVWAGTKACLQGPGLPRGDEPCRFGDPDPKAPLIALFGDSFANHHAPAFDAVARQLGYGLLQVTKAGCQPMAPRPLGGSQEAQNCEIFRGRSLEALAANPEVRLVAIGGLWSAQPDLPAAMADLRKAVEQLRRAGKAVLLVGPPPDFGLGFGARCVLRRRFLGLDESVCNISAETARERAAGVEQGLAAIAASVPGVGLYLPREGFCDATSCRPTVPDGRLGYVDNGHLNAPGSLSLVPGVKSAVEKALAGVGG